MLLNGEKKFVSTNYLGKPNKGDQNHHDLVTTLGVQTRIHIPIIYADIKAVPRDNIKNIMNHLEGKTPTVVKASVALEFVNIDDWRTFVDYCNSAVFQALSEQNSANRKKLEAPACVDRNNMTVIRHNIEVLESGWSSVDGGGIHISKKFSSSHETIYDILGGLRAFIGPEEAEGLLRPLTEPRNFYSRICFSNRSFGVGAALVAAPILAPIKDQLLEIDLSDFIAGRPEAETLEVVNIFSAFDALLKAQSSLEELYLVNDGISEEAIQALYELIPSTDRLKRISSVPQQGSVLKGSIALTEALGTCTFLKNLDLRDNLFGVEAGVALSKIIPLHAGLAIAYLSYLNLEDEGATAIATALRQSAPSLKVLEMAGNNITGKSASTLAACIATKKCLTKLNLSENELKDARELF
ncbi:hypothetical protein GIB67_018844 [Kingdonia uniflora]|uniref:Uncharacterized protein n=1 Tax=Kingdonia uniflora TaxID=39325 RepID=A0A7J7NEH7_9MAGN|nr:hypothetical protein GIB67_018844 [Kingdonia uniflora]